MFLFVCWLAVVDSVGLLICLCCWNCGCLVGVVLLFICWLVFCLVCEYLCVCGGLVIISVWYCEFSCDLACWITCFDLCCLFYLCLLCLIVNFCFDCL